jgi:hypothetical protein
MSRLKSVTRRSLRPHSDCSFQFFRLRSAASLGRTWLPPWQKPVDWVKVVRSFGARIRVQVTTKNGAQRAFDLIANFLIYQGVEAPYRGMPRDYGFANALAAAAPQIFIDPVIETS